MVIDGGGAAAFGFRYQYLATAEEVLRVLIAYAGDIGDLALLVEPTRQELGGENGEDDNVVDFGVEGHGEVIRRVQVKASRSPSGLNPLRHSDARDIFDRGGRGGPSAAILTNKPIAKKLLKACGATASGQDGQVVYTLASKRSVEGDVTSSEQSIIYDNRPPAEIKRRVLELMRALRRDNARGQGERTAALLAALLLDTIFESAADLTQRRLSGRDLLEPSRV